jgi:hypothetical protein
VNYYTTVFALAQHHKYSIDEIENLMPYERDIYVDMLITYLNEKKEAEKG